MSKESEELYNAFERAYDALVDLYNVLDYYDESLYDDIISPSVVDRHIDAFCDDVEDILPILKDRLN